MFSRSLVLSVLVLSLAAFPLSGCSSSSSGGGIALPNQALVSDGGGISNWDVLLVGTETGRELVLTGSGYGIVPFTDRPITESWTLSFGSDGALTIGMLGDNGCIDTVPGSYTFNGTAGTISANWVITGTCDGNRDSTGVLTITNLALNTFTDTISGTFLLEITGHDQFTVPFNSTQTGTFLGTRVAPPTVVPPDPGLVGDWAGLADLLTSGLRNGIIQNNLGGASADWNIVATFDAVGNVVFNVTVTDTALSLPCADTYTFQYTYDGFVGQITGSWFLVNDCEGDLVDTGSLTIDFTSDGTTLNGTFNATSSGTDISSLPFSETDFGTVSLLRQ